MKIVLKPAQLLHRALYYTPNHAKKASNRLPLSRYRAVGCFNSPHRIKPHDFGDTNALRRALEEQLRVTEGSYFIAQDEKNPWLLHAYKENSTSTRER